jgi:hypothetical protein
MRIPLKRRFKDFVDSSLVPFVSYVSAGVPPRPVIPPRASGASELQILRGELLGRMPTNPALKGFKVYSQNDEDGIIEEILARVSAVGPLEKTFIEIGCANGLENNSHYLLLKGFRGCWIDGDTQNIEFIRSELGGLDFPQLQVRQKFVDRSNILEIIAGQVAFLGTAKPDFFSLDIDGNDLAIVNEALGSLAPKVLCVEYNPKFPPPTSLSIAYNPSHTWTHDDYHGASLQAFCDSLSDYRLVCCNLCGVNAFFVRKGLDSGFTDASVAELYQPFREALTCPVSGHPPSLKWLRDYLRTASVQR